MLRFLMSCLRGAPAGAPSAPAVRPRPEASRPSARMIDVEGMIRQASTRVSVDRLLQTGKKFIHLLSRDKIDDLINRAISTIVDKHRSAAAHRDAGTVARIQAEARAEFQELLEQHRRQADAQRAVETSRRTLDLELKTPLPEPAREAAPAASPGSFEDFARELDLQVMRIFAGRAVLVERGNAPEDGPALQQVQALLRERLSTLVDAHRGRFATLVEDPREVGMLRKRLEKLQVYVAALEAALKTLSTAKVFSSQQVQNLLRDLGLSRDDKNFEKKKEMLRTVLEKNQGIRRSARDLAARGVTLDAPMESADFSCEREPLSTLHSRSAS